MILFNIKYVFLIFTIISVVACSPKQGARYSSARSKGYPSEKHSSKNTHTYKPISKKPIAEKSRENISIRDQIVSTAISQLGTPYKSAGKTPETGFDCSGFTGYVFRSHGIQLSGPSHDQARQGIQKSMENLRPGDLAFFGHGTKITHVAIITNFPSIEECEVIHATTSAGVKKDLIWKSEYWKSRFLFGIDLIENNMSLTLRNGD